MSYRIRYTRTTNHIQGIAERTTGPATDNSATTGVVGYYAQSACPSLSRSGHTMGVTGEEHTDLATILEMARLAGARKLCKHCERAATKAITDAYQDAQRHAIEAAKRLDIATNTSNEQLIADAEDFAERMNDRYDDAAAAAGRCRIFHCERPTHESSAWCEAHTVTDTADDFAARINDAYTKAEATNAHMSPTACRLAAASAAHDEAMRIAHEVEGTSAQAEADAAYEAARAAYRAANANHRAAREAAEHEDATATATATSFAHCPVKWCTGEPCEGCRQRAADAEAAPATYAAALAALPVGTDVALYLPGDTTVTGSIAGTGTEGAMVKLDNGDRRQVAYSVVESFEYFDHDTDGGVWVDPIADADARDYAADTLANERASFAPLTAEPEAVYDAARALYRTAAARHEEHGGEDNRAAAAAAFDAFVTAARSAGKCIDFTCYAPAEFGSDHCQRHHQPVHARLDHTEPGKAIALITGGHGREESPQAWLAHEGGSWLLVDDYDGDTYNVKGPDAERAVHAWAALLGLRLDGFTVAVEYAGGPVSPPVLKPAYPVPMLEWSRPGGAGSNVCEAHGHAHDYQVTEHADAAGASLVAFLRGTTVDTYRRGYMTADDARKAAEYYEARYGRGYVPAE